MRISDGPMPLGGFCLSIFVGNILYQVKREEMVIVWMDRVRKQILNHVGGLRSFGVMMISVLNED